jgi:hypothetical protein
VSPKIILIYFLCFVNFFLLLDRSLAVFISLPDSFILFFVRCVFPSTMMMVYRVLFDCYFSESSFIVSNIIWVYTIWWHLIRAINQTGKWMCVKCSLEIGLRNSSNGSGELIWHGNFIISLLKIIFRNLLIN